MEREGQAFHERVAEAFQAFATRDWQRAHPECGPIVPIEAAGSERDVAERIRAALSARWPGTFPDIRASDH